MTIALHEDHGPDEDRLLRLAEFLDTDGSAVRDLLVVLFEDRLADQLGDEETNRLYRDLILGIEERRLRQGGDQSFLEFSDTAPFQRRDQKRRLAEMMQRPATQMGNGILGGRIHLVDRYKQRVTAIDQDRLGLARRHRTIRAGRIQEQQDQIRIGHGGQRGLEHGPLKQVARFE